ncbi:hypothetical protein CR513_19599, partial [Mucuna pruriens]
MNGYSRIRGVGGDNSSEEEEGGERFGVILGRSVSLSSSSSTSSSSLKRAFSMRRSSSVTERYSRIHEEEDYTEITSPIPTSVNKKHTSGGAKILKACKRLLRFHFS